MDKTSRKANLTYLYNGQVYTHEVIVSSYTFSSFSMEHSFFGFVMSQIFGSNGDELFILVYDRRHLPIVEILLKDVEEINGYKYKLRLAEVISVEFQDSSDSDDNIILE